MSSVADRVREHRARKRSGVALITVAVDEVALVAALVEAGLLDVNMADDQGAIIDSVERLLEIFSENAK
jgi:hypothetical protein